MDRGAAGFGGSVFLWHWLEGQPAAAAQPHARLPQTDQEDEGRKSNTSSMSFGPLNHLGNCSLPLSVCMSVCQSLAVCTFVCLSVNISLSSLPPSQPPTQTQDVVRLYQALQLLPDVLASLEAYAGCHAPLLVEVVATPLSELSQDFSKFLQLVESTVDLDLVQQHQFLLKPSMDESLQRKPHSHSSHPHTSYSHSYTLLS